MFTTIIATTHDPIESGPPTAPPPSGNGNGNGTHNGPPAQYRLRPVPHYRPLWAGRVDRDLSDEAVSNGTLLVTLLWTAHRTARRFRRQLVNCLAHRNRELLEWKEIRGEDITEAKAAKCVACHYAQDNDTWIICPLCRAIEILTGFVSPKDTAFGAEALGESADELRLLLPWFPLTDRVQRLKDWHKSTQAQGRALTNEKGRCLMFTTISTTTNDPIAADHGDRPSSNQSQHPGCGQPTVGVRALSPEARADGELLVTSLWLAARAGLRLQQHVQARVAALARAAGTKRCPVCAEPEKEDLCDLCALDGCLQHLFWPESEAVSLPRTAEDFRELMPTFPVRDRLEGLEAIIAHGLNGK